MSVDAKLVKTLRERTGAGMMDCKKALVESKGDLDTAVDHLRKAGIAKAEKKSSRAANEGIIFHIYITEVSWEFWLNLVVKQILLLKQKDLTTWLHQLLCK